MGSAAARIQAMEGPWETGIYAGGSIGVVFWDDTGERCDICECWDHDFADLLVRAWAVPKLMDLLQRIVNVSGAGTTDPLMVQSHDLLERLSC